MKDALLFIVTGPSGSGKGTIMHAITDAFGDIEKIATYTTRSPRSGEEAGYDYNFVTETEFMAKVNSGDIAEHEQVYNDYYYGSPSFDPARGPDRLMELDYKGMFKYRGITKRLVSIFIAPPSLAILKERINRRGSEVNLERRISNAVEQMQYADSYDYIIINDDIASASAEAVAIVRAERLRRDKLARAAQITRMCRQQQT